MNSMAGHGWLCAAAYSIYSYVALQLRRRVIPPARLSQVGIESRRMNIGPGGFHSRTAESGTLVVPPQV